MDALWIGLSLVAGGTLGAVVMWFARGQRIAALSMENARLAADAADSNAARNEVENLKGKLEGAARDRDDLNASRGQIVQLTADNAALRKDLEKTAAAHADQVGQLTALRNDFQDQFKLLANDVLKTSNEDFAKRAEDIFKTQKELTAREIDQRSAMIADLVKPLGESLKSYDLALKDIERSRVEGFSALNTTLSMVSAQQGEVKTATASLVNALRASPKTRGRWGEETLRRVMQLSGMVEHCDFETEKHYRGDDETLRPDAVIHVAGGRTIVVDAKAPVSAYLDAVASTSEEEREMLLKRHAAQLRERLVNLSSKAYWERIDGSTDCVVMFIPGDNFVSAAFERDPDLFEQGVKNRVLICTPTTFIALAKSISYGWRQEKLAANAKEVSRLGKELYARLSAMGDHVGDLGRQINNTARKFNALVGSMENSVLPHARRFNDLGVEGTAKPIEALPEVDTVVRFPQLGRDLFVSKGRE